MYCVLEDLLRSWWISYYLETLLTPKKHHSLYSRIRRTLLLGFSISSSVLSHMGAKPLNFCRHVHCCHALKILDLSMECSQIFVQVAGKDSCFSKTVSLHSTLKEQLELFSGGWDQPKSPSHRLGNAHWERLFFQADGHRMDSWMLGYGHSLSLYSYLSWTTS